MILEILGLGKNDIIWDLDSLVKKQNETKTTENQTKPKQQ